MTSKADLWAPLTDAEMLGGRARIAVASVQSSLYQRLKRTWQKRSGAIAWQVVRAGQVGHRDHVTALEFLRKANLVQLREIADAVRLGGERPKDADCKELWEEISRQVTLAQRDVLAGQGVVE
jgi:hypothetical protein